MKTVTYGTIKDWISHKPSAYLRHPKMQPGTCISGFTHYPEGTKSTYPASYGDGPPTLPYFGPSCFYMVTDTVYYAACAHYGVIGGCCVLSSGIAEDGKWYEVDPISCYEESCK